MGRILSQCRHISNHHHVHFKYLILFVNYTSIKLKKITYKSLSLISLHISLSGLILSYKPMYFSVLLLLYTISLASMTPINATTQHLHKTTSFKKLYFIIVDLQYCVNFCYTANDSVIHIYTFIYFFIFFSIIVYYRILNIVPCVIQ